MNFRKVSKPVLELLRTHTLSHTLTHAQSHTQTHTLKYLCTPTSVYFVSLCFTYLFKNRNCKASGNFEWDKKIIRLSHIKFPKD